jgi:hypothetical protein
MQGHRMALLTRLRGARRAIAMMSTSLSDCEHWMPRAERSSTLQAGAPGAAEQPFVAEDAPLGPSREVLELLVLHGDCGFLLDLWAL